MTSASFPTIELVPGDDWAGRIEILDAQGQPLDLTGWIPTVFEVRWSMGSVPLLADLAEAANGRVGFSATETQTAPLPLGSVASIALKMRSPAGIDETLYVAPVRGVHVATDAAVSVVRAGTQGPPGRAVHAVESAGHLSDRFGHDGDTAIIRSSGAEYRKAAGTWAPTGASFWGTLLDDAGAARDGAEQARQATATALADVTGLNATIAALSGGAHRVVNAADVVDVFVYDTRQDSDGGRWRDRCARCSWHREPLNTAVRGASRPFPQIALLVARPSSLAIHDLDDPACPMWMVVEAVPGGPLDPANAITAVCALNGLVLIATAPTTGLVHADFIADRIVGRRTDTTGYALAPIAGRNSGHGDIAGHWAAGLASGHVGAVAARVLPGTLTDPDRGLPMPTIDAFTAAGASRLHAGGGVTDRAASPGDAHASGDILADGATATVNVTGAAIELYAAHKSWVDGAAPDIALSASSAPALLAEPGADDSVGCRGRNMAIGQAAGLNILMRADDPALSMVCHVTHTYATGYQAGDIRLALAESAADTSDLVGTLHADDFASGIPAAWQTEHAAIATVSGQLEVTAGVPYGSAYREYPVVAGKPVRITGRARCGTAPRYAIRVHDGRFADPIVKHIFGAQPTLAPFSHTFVPSGTTVTVQVQVEDPVAGTSVLADDIVVEGGGIDRSAADNAPIIVGTVKREPVADGADIAAHTGFSASNYLEWPASAGFDFGAGDFALYGWLKAGASGTLRTVIERNTAPSAAGFALTISATGHLRWVLGDGNAPLTIEAPLPLVAGAWSFVVAGVRSGVAELWVDAERVVSQTAPGGVNNAAAVMRLGEAVSAGSPLAQGHLALWRIGATVPAADRIIAMHAAERPLMRAGAKALLPGLPVNAVTHDAPAGVLHVATGAGMARFADLERIASDAVAASHLHAVDGLIAHVASGDVTVERPPIAMRAAMLKVQPAGPVGPAADPPQRASTSGATPEIVARIPVPVGGGTFRIVTRAHPVDGGAGEHAAYEDVVSVTRPVLGDIALAAPSIQRVIAETAAGPAVSIGVDTVHQALTVTATGIASARTAWEVSVDTA